jgi:putative ATP-dependent endonuclease of OLD family
MYISRIFIKNFRNFRHLDLPLSDGVTCFIGENNCGKTNLFHAIRLVLDGALSTYRRRLLPEDLAAGLLFTSPEHVLISIEFSSFTGNPLQEALPFSGIMQGGIARISYRFRPKPVIREELDETPDDQLPTNLKMEDYAWEMTAGADGVDLNTITWRDNFGTRFSVEHLQQGYLLVLMEALRDVEARLAVARTSPLQQIVEQSNIPPAEQQMLVQHLAAANNSINTSTTIRQIGDALTNAFHQSAGKTYAMGVKLGLGEPSFTDISRGLKVLLSGYGLQDLDPSRNGLGLNNVLFVSMLTDYFERRTAEQRTAGQLLLVEEPEAHLHPQLQRVFLATLQQKRVQIFITTHSTHITSSVPLGHQVVLTSSGGPVTATVKPRTIPGMSDQDASDLDRYLDATRSSLLYARKVLLVEGPAEQFLIPRLAKKVLNIDLDQEGVAVVPIFGTHFAVYAKLFGTGGISKKCAILADGDLKPSDADPEAEIDDVLPELVNDLAPLRSTYVGVFQCQTTFEREITMPGTLQMFETTARELGAPQVANELQLARQPAAQGTRRPTIEQARSLVLNSAKRFGKARFAQVASKHVNLATEVPPYIREALTWLTTDATNNRTAQRRR